MTLTQLMTLMATTAVVAASLVITPPAEARSRQTTVTGAQGKTLSRQVTRDHGDVSSSTTGPNGKTASRVVDRSPEATTATVTGPNGQTASRTTTRTTPRPATALHRRNEP